jgi:hypothetical protein
VKGLVAQKIPTHELRQICQAGSDVETGTGGSLPVWNPGAPGEPEAASISCRCALSGTAPPLEGCVGTCGPDGA